MNRFEVKDTVRYCSSEFEVMGVSITQDAIQVQEYGIWHQASLFTLVRKHNKPDDVVVANELIDLLEKQIEQLESAILKIKSIKI